MPFKTNYLVDGTHATFSGKALAGLSEIEIKQESILVCLSIMGNSHCEGPHLKAIIKHAIDRHKKAFFLIGDETHWHNLRGESYGELDIYDLKEKAIKLGSEYLQKILPIFLSFIKQQHPTFDINTFRKANINEPMSTQVHAINEMAAQFGVPFTIIRWHDWVNLENTTFAAKQADIMALYHSDTQLSDSLETSTNDFVKRHQQKAIEQVPSHRIPDVVNHLKQCSRNYLSEEAPAIFYIAAELGIRFIAYPGKQIKLFQTTRDFFIKQSGSPNAHPLSLQVETPQSLANWLEIRFKRKKNHSNLEAYSLFNQSNDARVSLGEPLLRRSKSLDQEDWVPRSLIHSHNSTILRALPENTFNVPPKTHQETKILHQTSVMPSLLNKKLTENSQSCERDELSPLEQYISQQTIFHANYPSLNHKAALYSKMKTIECNLDGIFKVLQTLLSIDQNNVAAQSIENSIRCR